VLCAKARIFGEQIDGTFAGFVCAPEPNVFHRPKGLDFFQAASLSVAWLTAWRMIRTKARTQPGETVLVFGVGGSVSLAATQILAAMGARPIVTSRDARKLERARTFGATETIQDTGGNVLDRVMELTNRRGVDVVIENVGEAVWPTASLYLA
jgi:NADPH:quinone reductase-like Zn-dependent oxidoreductase